MTRFRSVFFLSSVAALCAWSAPGNLLAASKATVDLSGAVIQNGQTIDLTSDAALDAVTGYHYKITGNCHGTGVLKDIIPKGTPIKTAMDTIGASAFADALTGDVANPAGTLPVTVVNQPIDGSFGPFPTNPIASAHADVLAEIADTGLVQFTVDNVSVMVNGSPDNSSIVFEKGAKCVVTTSPVGDFQPDVSLETGGGTVGDGVYNDNSAQTVSSTLDIGSAPTDFTFDVGNDGTAADTVFVKAAAAKPGFKIKYLLGGTANVTSSISSTGILVDLDAGQTVHLVATVTVKKSAQPGTVQNLSLKTSSQGDASKTDQGTFKIKTVKVIVLP